MKNQAVFIQVILAFLFFIGGLFLVRVYLSGTLKFLFLFWNLFLAFVPFIIVEWLWIYCSTSKRKKVIFLGIGAWLLFFPNSLYIVTDFIHLKQSVNVPIWLDVVLLFSSAFVGLLFAFASLNIVEKLIDRIIPVKRREVIIFLVLFLGSFGVYLGRFLRWNSWDVVQNPQGLVIDILDRFFSPHLHLHTWGITALLSVLFYLLYFTVRKIPHFLDK